ncbi:4-hydroxy-tetrahydrodipicolinate synthase [Occallatibacter savannae]|uniref:4-hydroxy-tetrahydrodipicolinate synthase n=1 Tax=Occallatibacter savannae TaxID=1002691 RepID=UPI0030843428
MMETTGCGTAIVTPFRADGTIDEPALWALVNWQIDAGIDFIVACGSTGEAATLDEQEWLQAIRIVVEAAAGRVPVWAGCTHNCTRVLLHQAAMLRQVPGVDAVLSANPYYNKPTQEGQFQHFLALAKMVAPLPVCLYNVPGRTGVNLDPQTVVRLIEAAPNIQAIKEASGKLPQIAEIVHSAPSTFKVFSGDDNLALAAIGVGAQGLISVASNEIPAEMARMINAALHDEWAEAREIERRFGRLFDANFWESNPGPVKTVLNLMGRSSDTLRLPLVPPTVATRSKLERLAGELGLLKFSPIPAGDMRMY